MARITSHRGPLVVALVLAVAGVAGAFAVYRTGSSNRADDLSGVVVWRAAVERITQGDAQARAALQAEADGGAAADRESVRRVLETSRAQIQALRFPSILTDSRGKFDAWYAELIEASRAPGPAGLKVALDDAERAREAAFRAVTATEQYLRS